APTPPGGPRGPGTTGRTRSWPPPRVAQGGPSVGVLTSGVGSYESVRARSDRRAPARHGCVHSGGSIMTGRSPRARLATAFAAGFLVLGAWVAVAPGAGASN